MQYSPAPRRGARTLLVMIGVVLLAAAVITGVLLLDQNTTVSGRATATTPTGTTDHSQPTEPSPTEPGRDRGGADALVGDCVKFNSVRLDDTLAQEIDCAASDATYEVGFRLDGVTTGTCPTQSYDQYTQTGPDGDFMLCLMMNGKEGDCFTGYSTPDEWKAKVDCATANVVVSARLNDRVDPSVCAHRLPDGSWCTRSRAAPSASTRSTAANTPADAAAHVVLVLVCPAGVRSRRASAGIGDLSYRLCYPNRDRLRRRAAGSTVDGERGRFSTAAERPASRGSA